MKITIEDSYLEEKITETINATLTKQDSYNNPIVKIVEKIIGSTYKGERSELGVELTTMIEVKVKELINSEGFNTVLGVAVAEAIAKREIKNKI